MIRIHVFTFAVIVHCSLCIIKGLGAFVEVVAQSIDALPRKYAEYVSLMFREFYFDISTIGIQSMCNEECTWWCVSAEVGQVFSEVEGLNPCQAEMCKLWALVE